MFHCALAISVVVLASAKTLPIQEDFEPCSGLFSTEGPPELYRLAVRASLLGEGWDRTCQIVAIPSFEEEWAVYLVPGLGAPPEIVFKRMRLSLYHEMCRVLEEGSEDGSYSFDPEAQAAAIARLQIGVEQSTTSLDEQTALLLERVWEGMLSRVRYPPESIDGCDGVSYYAAHWSPKIGFLSGQTWSPDKGTRAAAMVDIAEKMCRLAEASPPEKWARENALIAAARALEVRLQQEAELDRRR